MTVLTLALAISTTSCGHDGPSPDEAQVCSSIQHVVDALAGKQSQSAIDGLTPLKQAVDGTKNSTLSTAGKHFIDSFVIEYDPNTLTMEQGRQLGEQYLETMSTDLHTMVNECANVGAAIKRLPT